MKTTKQILTDLLQADVQPPWTIAAIARAADVPFHAVRRYIKEPGAGVREPYRQRLDAFARKHAVK